MADQEQLERLQRDMEEWRQWREDNPEIQPDLSYADLSGADLSHANLNYANLSKAYLDEADLSHADLSEADLSGTVLSYANLSEADLSSAGLDGANLSHANLTKTNLANAELDKATWVEANLSETDLSGRNFSRMNLSRVNLSGANLSGVRFDETNLSGVNFSRANLSKTELSRTDLSGINFSGANLSGANLNEARLIKTDFSHANLTNCSIYGIAAWDIQLDEKTIQIDLTITPPDQPAITVDNLKVAQFIYLLLNNTEIRDVIDTITSKVVLVLGRFTPERKAILNTLRDELRKKNYLPIVFDFEKPASRNLTETISTLAHIARFVIADITQAKSIPQELERIIPDLSSVPVQPLLQARAKEYGMFEHFKRYPWVLETHRYTTIDRLLVSLKERVIEPAEQKAQELAKR